MSHRVPPQVPNRIQSRPDIFQPVFNPTESKDSSIEQISDIESGEIFGQPNLSQQRKSFGNDNSVLQRYFSTLINQQKKGGFGNDP
jgi:hypothetical protein